MNRVVIIYYQNDTLSKTIPWLPSEPFTTGEYCCLVTLRMVRISYDSLLLACSCCVLNQLPYLLSFWRRKLRSFISITFNYLHILPKTQVPQHFAQVMWQRGLHQSTVIKLFPFAPRSPKSAVTILVQDPAVWFWSHHIPGLKCMAYEVCLVVYLKNPLLEFSYPHLL